MLSFPSPTTLSSLLASTKRETSLTRYAARVAECSAASLILPRLYLSNYRIAADEEELAKLGITHVVSILEYPPEYTNLKIKTLQIKLVDSFQSNILEHLQTTTNFIKHALEENETNQVLVHCMMGVSRSATVVCAYLVATTSMTAPEAIEFARSKRSIVSPNLGFRRQLVTYEEQLCEIGLKVKLPPDAKHKVAEVGMIESTVAVEAGEQKKVLKVKSQWLQKLIEPKKAEH